jgi:hypothetical protein
VFVPGEEEERREKEDGGRDAGKRRRRGHRGHDRDEGYVNVCRMKKIWI